MVCKDHVMEYTDHAVGCTSHGDHLRIDQAVSRFVYSEKNVYCLRIRTIIRRAAMTAYVNQEMCDLNKIEEREGKTKVNNLKNKKIPYITHDFIY